MLQSRTSWSRGFSFKLVSAVSQFALSSLVAPSPLYSDLFSLVLLLVSSELLYFRISHL